MLKGRRGKPVKVLLTCISDKTGRQREEQLSFVQHRVWGHEEELLAWAFSETPVGFIIVIRAGLVPSGVSGLSDVLEPWGCGSPLVQKVIWSLCGVKPFPFCPGTAAVVRSCLSRAALSRTESRSGGNVFLREKFGDLCYVADNSAFLSFTSGAVLNFSQM